MNSQRYYLGAVFDNKTINLLEKSLSEQERLLSLTVDLHPSVELSFSPWYLPGLFFHSSTLAVWCGARIYVFDCNSGKISSFNVTDEVHAAYVTADRWCLVCETSVILFDSESGIEVEKFEHDEVILNSWWLDEGLLLEDFEGRKLRFDLKAQALELVPRWV